MNPLITTIKNATSFTRSIALVTIFAHLFLILSPSAMAMSNTKNKESHSNISIETELSENYIKAVEKLAQLKQLREEDKNTDLVLSELKSIKSTIETLDKEMLESFVKTKTELNEKELSEVITTRHDEMTAHYKSKKKAFMSFLTKETESGFITDIKRNVSNFFSNKDKTERVHAGNSVTDGTNVFKTSDFKRSQQAFDPKNLGSQNLRPDTENKPKTTKQEFINSGLRSSPSIKLSALGDFSFDRLEEASDPLYLAESDEVQLTQSIRDKAAELDHDAVKIYHWVRNNIEWLPSWGAIQDAELTLEAQRGNSMDIASLTISLLRASQIPARYVHGTIDVPPEQFMNWAGGFTSLTAAGDYASSAGIPITLQTSNYPNNVSIQTVRMEHVWVEAATDFQPSRGAINQDADTWVQLDPSFKQYEFQEGLDVASISGLDVDQFTQNFTESGTVNEAEGWYTGFDSTILQQAQAESEINLLAHIATLDNPTVGDIIGGKKTIIKEYPTLPSSSPNRIVIIGTRYYKLPNQLQQKIEFALAANIIGEMIDPITFSYAKLNNEKVNLSFKPATQIDKNALTSLVPEGATDINQLPTSIPSTINVIPELKVDGIVIKTGSVMKLGEELSFVTGIRFAGKGYIRTPRTYKVIAGSFLNVNVFAGSVSPVKLEKLQIRLEETKGIIESENEELISALNRDIVWGDIFYAGALGYYSQLLSFGNISGIKSKGFYQMAAGYGTIGYEPEVNSLFGQPRSIVSGGVAFDIPMINVIANEEADIEKARQLTLQIGTLSSALEHIVPEQMFASIDTSTEKLDAISSVKALQKASAAGQKIYQIDPTNLEQVLPLLQHDPDSISEIIRAVNAGKNVTTHTDAVSIPGGWSGFGYIITDPIVGDGVYKISGGANGGWLATLFGVLLAMIAWIPAAAAFPPALGVMVLVALVALTFANTLNGMEGCAGDMGVILASGAAATAAIPGKKFIRALKAFVIGFIVPNSINSGVRGVCG